MRIRCLIIMAATLFATLPGCTTPTRRARQLPVAFHHLSAADQQLVLHGKIHPGMNKKAVYIAWGSPDLKLRDDTKDDKGNEEPETWLYECRLTIAEPFGATDQYGPNHGLGFPLAPLNLQTGFGFRGIGDGAFFHYQPHVRVVEVRYRRAEFSHGTLTQYVDRGDGRLALESALALANVHPPPPTGMTPTANAPATTPQRAPVCQPCPSQTNNPDATPSAR